MEDIYEWKGLNGQLVTFKKEIGDAEKITFIGSPGVCTPFAEFLAYSVRDKETHFIPLLDIDDCHEFESKPYAMVLSDEVSDPHGSDAVVLLGGLSMPKYDVDTEELNALVDEILKEADILIDGPFIQQLKNLNLLWRGSSNQRIIDLKKTNLTQELVIIPDS